MAEFIKGLQLSKNFYEEIGKPILQSNFPDLNYSAALVGHGSEVLGFDNVISSDHDWGPRFILFLKPSDYEQYKGILDEVFNKELPDTYNGYSVKPDNVSDVRADETFNNSKTHRIEITTIPAYFEKEIGINPQSDFSVKEWLMLPSQKLLSVTKGEVFSNGLNELNSIREKLEYYPKDIWVYMLASQWQKISQVEPFMGRTADVGDLIGSRIISARLVKYIMELCFLMERQYIPYTKWFGTGFAQLNCSSKLTPVLSKILDTLEWKAREQVFAEAYETIATIHNDLNLTEPLDTKVSTFYGRPYLVIHADNFAKALKNTIANPELKDLHLIGSADQFIDSTDIIEDSKLLNKFKNL